MGANGTDKDKVSAIQLLIGESNDNCEEAQRLLSLVQDKVRYADEIRRLEEKLRLWERANRAANIARSDFFREALGAK